MAAAPPKQPREVVQPTGPVSLESGITVRDFSQAVGVGMQDIIKILMGLGALKTATQSLTDDEVELLAAELKREVTIKHAGDEDVEPEIVEDDPDDLVPRPPVVTIMGHVDHGKTTLLDAIRNAKVVETEAGGITQHIGAYQVPVDGRRVTFLDTPGHEAFTAMRARGAKVTDIAVLVVAADDGVMPQTRESIAHARAAEVPIVVAVNKIDLPDANPERVLGDLAAEGLQPEEWGGDTQVARVSAREQTGLDELLGKVLLVADAELELQANPKAEASGPIIESRLDVGRGPVATMLVQRGTLRVGDAVVAGDAWGKVRALYNYKGEKLKEAKPGDPVEILGFDKPPPAGEFARVVETDRDARDLAQKRAERLRREQFAIRPSSSVSLESLFDQLQAGEVKDLNLVVKGDVQGSIEAIVGELAKIQHPEVRVNVIHQGVGGITENDVDAGRGLRRDGPRLQRPAERRDARGRRARRRRDPDLQRHLQADRGHPAGPRRDAHRGHDRGDDRRGRGARDLPRLPRRHDRRLHGHERPRPPRRERPRRSATARSSTRRRSTRSSASRTTRARCRKASSAASTSRTTTTSRSATCSRCSRRARSRERLWTRPSVFGRSQPDPSVRP